MAKRGKLKYSFKDTLERPVRSRCYKQFFLIACEDTKGEPAYFDEFKKMFDSLSPDDTVLVRPLGTGFDPLGVVKHAIKEKEIYKKEKGKDADFVWAVFDKDDNDENDTKIEKFAEALQIAKDNHIKIAFSNECFELWFLLHFSDVNQEESMPRETIYTKLQDSINKGRTPETQIVYTHKHPQKGELDSAGLVPIIFNSNNESMAIQRATRLRQFHLDKMHSELESNPRTDVDLLVTELRGLYSFYAACL